MDLFDLPCPHCGSVQAIPAGAGTVRCDFCGAEITFRTRPRPGVLAPEGGGAAGSIHALVTCPCCSHRFAADAPVAPRPRALVVEPTPFFRDLARRALAQRFSVTTVGTVADALAVLAQGTFGLLVADLLFADGDVLDLLRGMPDRRVPVLIFSSGDESKLLGPEWEVLRQHGACDALQKRLHVEDLLLKKAEDLVS